VRDGVAHPDEKRLIEGLTGIPVVKHAANATHGSTQNEKGKKEKWEKGVRSQNTGVRRKNFECSKE
jgi:hypothetical protein